MRVLVTGASGQMGWELSQQAADLGWHVTAFTHEELDIAEEDAVQDVVRRVGPDAVLNAAAYTAVDRAESEPEMVFSVNRDGPRNLAAICDELGISLVHYSTDCVFDGDKVGAYVEDDPAAPLGVYGKSKWEGEQAIREVCKKHLILRTSWVFASHGHNFVRTMLKLGSEQEFLRVVADQRGCPCCAAEVARITLAILPDMSDKWGTYHLAQPEAISWHGFAEAIFAEARRRGISLRVREVEPIETKDYPTPARRPLNSVLDCQKLVQNFGVNIHPWRESLAEVIGVLQHG